MHRSGNLMLVLGTLFITTGPGVMIGYVSISVLTASAKKPKPNPRIPLAPAIKVIYSCPMHPEIVVLKAGVCSKYGMPLTQKVVQTLYACPTHRMVLSLKPGKCVKCGKRFIKIKG